MCVFCFDDHRVAVDCPNHKQQGPKECLGHVKHVISISTVQATVLTRKCEECTSANLLETDWQLHRQLCLMMGEGDVGYVSLGQSRSMLLLMAAFRAGWVHQVGCLQGVLCIESDWSLCVVRLHAPKH